MWKMHETSQQPCDFLPPLKIYAPCQSEVYHAHPPRTFSAHPTVLIFGPCIDCDKFVAALQPQFPIFLTEVCHIAHFWESFGRCVMHGLPVG